MKKYIIGICIVCAASFAFYACNEEDFSSKEFYEYLVFLLSKEDNNVYNVLHPFVDDGDETIGYFSIGVGGSLPNPGAFTVELEQNNTLFNRYNRLVFDVDSNRFARLLSPDKYHIDRMTVDFPANNRMKHVRVRVHVDNQGLSPDSTYFIPLAIKSVTGGYQTNPEKVDMLYRIIVENYYAEQIRMTTYIDRGRKLEVRNPNAIDISEVIIVNDSLGQVSETKAMKPLSKNSVRILAGEEKESRLGNPTVDELVQGAMILTVLEDEYIDAPEGEYKNVSIKPYGTIQIEQIDGEPFQPDGAKWNIYREEIASMASDKKIKFFYLRYRYRTLIVDDYYTDWVYIQSVLRKQE